MFSIQLIIASQTYMNVYTCLQIGEFHTNHCEDFLIHEELGNKQFLVAVMDGCTMGKESAFAAMLYGKILRKIAKEVYYTGLNTSGKETLKQILKQLISEARQTQNSLDLEVNELLSTLILGIVNCNNASAELLVVGDGLIHYDGNVMAFDQNDRPDYLGYHLSSDFETWYSKQNQFVSISHFHDLSIATDGIFTFKNFRNLSGQKTEDEIITFLLKEKEDTRADRLLEEKIRYLREEKHHIVTDDLAIVRIINQI